MSILNRMGKKNKESEHYQRNYEEVAVEGKGITIGIGSEGLVRGKQEEKEQYYIMVREKITQGDKDKIKNIMLASRTVYEIFSKLEDIRMPLDYLVALGLVEEIDIESYQNVKVKGLDASRTLTGEELLSVDENLRMQVIGQTEELPVLRDSLTDEEIAVGNGIDYIDSYQEAMTRNINKSKEEVKEGVAEKAEDVTKESDEGLEQETEEVVEEEVDEGAKGLQELTNVLRKNSEREKREEKRKLKRLEQERIRNIRDVYVIAKDILMPQIDGYNIILVESMDEIIEYTSSKRNILVVTQNIPGSMQAELMRWLRGIEQSDSKYRIVTQEGSAVGHTLIETKVSLEKESLDKYCEDFPDSGYEGKDVESFYDIGNFFKGKF